MSPTGGRYRSAPTSPAMRTAAVPRRAASTRPDRSGHFGPFRLLDLLAGAPEAPLALAIGLDRQVQRGGVEVRPQRFGEVQLAVGELPEQEVADALLAAGADEQVGLRRVRHREVARRVGFPHLAGRPVRVREAGVD